MFEHIPKELRDLPQWVARCGKVPIDPNVLNRGAKAGKPDTWGTFERAVEVHAGYACSWYDNNKNEGMHGKTDGIGFQMNNNGLVFIDLDHVIDMETGEVDPEAIEVVDMLNSYTEISPSGTGLHIFVRGNIPRNGKKRNEREMYKAARYATMTGIPFGDPRPLAAEDRTKELAKLWARWFPDKDKPTPATQPVALLGDASVGGKDYLAIGLEKDEKLRALWYGERPNGNESSDDQALMNKLAYWRNRDREQMKAAFLSSPHFQSKDDAHQRKAAERADYLDRTIAEAIRTCTQTAQETDARFQEHRHPSAENDFTSSQAQEWEPPIPFDSVDVPPFPVDRLPDPVRSFVLAVAENLQVAVDLPAASVLAVVALCVQGKLVVCPKSDWKEPLNLYVVNIAPPSERKSPVMNAMVSPIYEYTQMENEFREPLIQEYNTKKAVLEKRISNMTEAMSKVKKGKLASTEFTLDDIVQAKSELSELDEVKPLRLLADDTTQEALQRLMADNNGRMAIVSAEGGIFEIMAGRYTSKSVNVEVFLKAYSGDPIFVDRVGRAGQQIPHPALTMLLSVQPVVIRNIMKNSAFRGRGLLARFLYSQPTSKVGSRQYNSDPISQGVRDNYRSLIHDLLGIKSERECIRFDSGAYEESKKFFDELEPQHMNQLFEIGDWSGKFHGTVMRIAGILHCMKYGHEAASCLVNAQTVKDAIAIGEYFLEHTKAVFLTVSTSDTDDAGYILRRLKEDPPKGSISKRDILRRCRKFHTADDLSGALSVLIDCGYLREAPREEYKGSGRRPSERYDVNPFLLNSLETA